MELLSIGSKGHIVKEIQAFLGLGASGDFTKATQKAVARYQALRKLTIDGKVGPQTLNSMVKDGLEISLDKGKEMKPFTLPISEVVKIIQSNAHSLVADSNKYNKTKTIFDPTKHLVVVGVRGFDLRMGKPNENDRRIYDDAHFIYTPDNLLCFQGNLDPNGFRAGFGTGSNKGMAMLNTGVWFFAKGKHKGRLAFRQAAPFTVTRDGDPPYEDTDYHAINWHDGGVKSTSSLGCQTNKPDDFSFLRSYIYKKLEETDNPFMFNDWNQKERAFPYILIDETERAKGHFVV